MIYTNPADTQVAFYQRLRIDAECRPIAITHECSEIHRNRPQSEIPESPMHREQMLLHRIYF